MPRILRLSLIPTLALAAVAACGDRGEPSRSAIDEDSALARDLTLAAIGDSVQPELRDVPVGPPEAPATAPVPATRRVERTARTPVRRAPVTEAPRPSAPTPVTEPAPAPTPVEATPAPAPAPNVGTIAAGTSIGIVTGTRACSNGSRPGDKMVARTSETLTGTNGVVFPAGSAVVVEIASIVESPSADSSQITFRVKSITVNDVTHPVTGDVIPLGSLEKTRVESRGSDTKKVVGGAIAGAILGQIIGKDTKGTVIGAAAGAAAGTVAASRSAKYQSCLPAGATMRLTLSQPIVVQL